MRILLLLFSFLTITTYQAQEYHKDPRWPSPNGKVNKVIIDSASNQVFVGGDFDYVGTTTEEHLFIYDAANNKPLEGIDHPNGSVYSTEKDNSSGWFIGGDFTEVAGQKRGGIAHIDNKGKLITDLADISVNGRISTMKKLGDSLFIGGTFTSVGKSSDFNLGSILLDNNGNKVSKPFPEIDGKVTCSYTDDVGGIYIGGAFIKVGDSLRHNLAYIDSNGILSAWKPFVDKQINAIIGKGDSIIIGGEFESVNKQPKTRLAAIHKVNGNVFSWGPKIDGTVHSLLLNYNNLYVGGDFATVNDSSRNNFAEFSIQNGLVTSFNLQVSGASSSIRCMQMKADSLYLGGYFTGMLGQNRRKVAAIDVVNKTLLSWNPDVATFSFVYDLEIVDTAIYIAGNFMFVNSSIQRPKIAAVHSITGSLLPFNSNFANTNSNHVTDIFVKGNVLYFVGSFGGLGGQTRTSIGAVNRISGALTNWNPATSSNTFNINHITDFNNQILVCGEDILFGGNRSEKLAAIDLSGDSLLDWNPPRIDGAYGGSIEQIEGFNDTLIICGDFHTLGSSTRNNIAFLDKNTASILPLTINVDGKVKSIALDYSTLYISGIFTTVGGVSREKLASVNVTNGQVLPFNANITGGNSSFLVKVFGNTLYAAGNYWSIGGQNNVSLAALDKYTGTASVWDPKAGIVNGLEEYNGDLYLGGGFKEVNFNDQLYFGRIDKDSAYAKPFLHGNNSVNTMSISNGNILYGGNFTSVGGEIRKSFAAYDLTTGSLTNMTINAEHFINDMELVDSNLIISGNIFWVTSQNGNIAAFNTSTGLKNTSMFNGLSSAGGEPLDIEISGNTLYIAGDFRSINNQLRYGIASYDMLGDSLLPWYPNPSINTEVTSIALDGDDIYMGGSFGSMQGQTRRKAAKVSRTTGALSIWNPNVFPDGPNEILIHGSKVLLGGGFSNVGNQINSFLVAVDDSLGIIDSTFSLKPNGNINSLSLQDSMLYIGGNFSSIKQESRISKAILNLNSNQLSNFNPDSQLTQGYYDAILNSVKDIEANGELIFIGSGTGLEVYNSDTTDFCVLELVANETKCESYFWSKNNTSYYQSGSYSTLKKSMNSCDTLFKLNLTINTISIQLTTTNNNTILATDSNANYQWLDCNNSFAAILGETNQFFSPSTNGIYAVELSKQNCKDTSNCVNMSTVSISEIKESSIFHLFPNPTSEDVFYESVESVERIELFNVHKQVSESLHFSNKIIKTSHLKAGIYFLKVTFKNKEQSIHRIVTL